MSDRLDRIEAVLESLATSQQNTQAHLDRLANTVDNLRASQQNTQSQIESLATSQQNTQAHLDRLANTVADFRATQQSTQLNLDALGRHIDSLVDVSADLKTSQIIVRHQVESNAAVSADIRLATAALLQTIVRHDARIERLEKPE